MTGTAGRGAGPGHPTPSGGSGTSPEPGGPPHGRD
ncbi:MAG: hypothetical protein QOF76_94, partial [Solirubrobacteraceae bacterium]|nr:hypothetical protein [Solirubrobacteraceae bacterium]